MTLAAGIVLASAACTVNSVDVPELTGPSELALSFRVTANPDSIAQDGVSQSGIVVTAKGPNGQPLAGQPFRLDIFVGGVAADYGTLSGKTVVTGSDGTARAVYTAPPGVPPGADVGSCRGLPGPCVTISATPTLSGFFAGVTIQEVDIHLVPLGTILPPADTPTASFVVTPTPVTVNVATNFDASASCAGAIVNGSCSSADVITSYQWGFGDGASGTGRTASHAYSAPGDYIVTLTVTNSGGKSASIQQSVSVSAGSQPTANFVFSPSSPVVGQQIQFNGSQSQAAPGRSLVRFDWNFGDGETQTGGIVQKNYLAAGTFSVTLTVTDDTGSSGTTSRTVTVGSGAPTASLNVSKSVLVVTADASGSTAVSPATITDYSFNWGDGSPVQSGAASIRTHDYGATLGAGTYAISLTVTDSVGRTRTVIQAVTVP
jgi:PKD repeat protein